MFLAWILMHETREVVETVVVLLFGDVELGCFENVSSQPTSAGNGKRS